MTHQHERNRRPSRLRRFGARARRGVSLVEVMVGLVVLTIGMLGTAGTLLHAARAATQMSSLTGREAMEMQLLNRIAAIPYDALTSLSGCTTIAPQPFPHTHCIGVTDVSGGSGAKSIQIIVKPADTRLRADTVYLTRSAGVAISPLSN